MAFNGWEREACVFFFFFFSKILFSFQRRRWDGTLFFEFAVELFYCF